MHSFILKVADKLRSRYDPSPLRRAAVIQCLAHRPALTHDEWHRHFAASRGIPMEFVIWFRDMCSRNFEFDLSGALPEDRLREDLGMNDATWGDTSWDLVEDYEERFGVQLPDEVEPPIETFGQLLDFFWLHVRDSRTKG